MVKRIVVLGLAVVLALPAARGRDEPKDEKKPDEKKALSPREQYDALAKEYVTERRQVLAVLQGQTKGDEYDKALRRYQGMGREYAEKFLKLADEHPKDPAAADALFWALQNAPGNAKAEQKVLALVADTPLADLASKLALVRTSSAPLFAAVLKRAEKEEPAPAVGNLLAWIASNRPFAGKVDPSVETATRLLVEKFPDDPAVGRIMQLLARGRSPENVETLKAFWEKAASPRVKAEAALALGQNLVAQHEASGGAGETADKLAAEAEAFFERAVALFAKEKLTAKKEAAELELKAFTTIRVGKEAPEISGKDLDAKAFKLSDYRGKVVLLDFWGNW